MGVDGQLSTEPGGSNIDKIFFMKYPYPFLQYWYGNFPLAQQETIPTTPSKAVVFKHWTLVSDDLITAGRNSGSSTCILSQNPSLTMLTFCGHTVVACLGT
jgi:hypothetical protein